MIRSHMHGHSPPRGNRSPHYAGGFSLKVISPVIAAAALTAMLLTTQFSSLSVDQIDAFQARVREAVNAIPNQVGAWIGRDVPATAAATALLKPNVTMQRAYYNPKLETEVSVLIVHCGDVRDMGGHYPPICYPAHGWTRGGSDAHTAKIEGLPPIPYRTYSFRRVLVGLEDQMEVADFFVLPAGETRFTDSIDDVRHLGEFRGLAGLGAAQVQILYSTKLPADEREKVVRQFIEILKPSILVISRGVDQ